MLDNLKNNPGETSNMAHAPDIWTGSVRRVLYGRLVSLFGPYKNWKKKSQPGRDMDDKFNDFCSAFAVAVGAKSGDAVKHQIAFALPETVSGSTWKAQVQTAISNKAPALEMGFIEDRHLPELLAVARNKPPGQVTEVAVAAS
jgi:hypothetical protein